MLSEAFRLRQFVLHWVTPGQVEGLEFTQHGGLPALGLPFWHTLGVPIIRTLVFWGLYWCPLFWDTTTWLMILGNKLQGSGRYCLLLVACHSDSDEASFQQECFVGLVVI